MRTQNRTQTTQSHCPNKMQQVYYCPGGDILDVALVCKVFFHRLCLLIEECVHRKHSTAVINWKFGKMQSGCFCVCVCLLNTALHFAVHINHNQCLVSTASQNDPLCAISKFLLWISNCFLGHLHLSWHTAELLCFVLSTASANV